MPGNNDNRANQMNPNNDAYWESRGMRKVMFPFTHVSIVHILHPRQFL